MPNTPFCTRLSGSARETELRLRNTFQWKKKRLPVVQFVLVAVTVLSCCGLVSCQAQENVPPADGSVTEPPAVSTDAPVPSDDLEPEITPAPSDDLEPENTPAPSPELLSFADLRNVEFYFASGVGAWSTTMMIQADGSFAGEYSDSDMNIQYYCAFSGQFGPLVKVNEYTYSTQIDAIQYENEVGTEEAKDGILYRYSDAYGLENAENILIYLPGAPLAELPQEFRNWVGYHDLTCTEDTELPFFGLYNEADQCGFSGYDIVESLKESLAAAEEYTKAKDNYLKTEPLTQTEMNGCYQGLYQYWDSLLNRQWAVLKKVLPPETMDVLLAEQREWIRQKEAAVAEAGKVVEGGSLYPTVTYSKAKEITMERVYELMEWLE